MSCWLRLLMNEQRAHTEPDFMSCIIPIKPIYVTVVYFSSFLNSCRNQYMAATNNIFRSITFPLHKLNEFLLSDVFLPCDRLLLRETKRKHISLPNIFISLDDAFSLFFLCFSHSFLLFYYICHTFALLSSDRYVVKICLPPS